MASHDLDSVEAAREVGEMGENQERAREALSHLSISEKLQIVHDLWDEIGDSPQVSKITPAQRAELERREREHEDNPADCTSWDQIRRALEDRR